VVFIVVDIALIALWLSVMRTSPDLTSLLVASIVTLAVGACCLAAVLVLGRRWRTPVAPGRPNRSTAASVLSAVSVLQLVGGFTALLVLGAFTTGNGITVLGATMIEAVVVAALGVSVGRHVARTAAGVRG
jgi:hypothetical protein